MNSKTYSRIHCLQTQIMSPKVQSHKRGFAVIIALTLMAFIVLLLLSMTTLVRVETQTADISKSQLIARQNALMGLKVAVGQLQRYTGPDRVATATSEYVYGKNILVNPTPPDPQPTAWKPITISGPKRWAQATPSGYRKV